MRGVENAVQKLTRASTVFEHSLPRAAITPTKIRKLTPKNKNNATNVANTLPKNFILQLY